MWRGLCTPSLVGTAVVDAGGNDGSELQVKNKEQESVVMFQWIDLFFSQGKHEPEQL